MENNNLKNLIKASKNTEKQAILIENVNFLINERIKLVGNSIRTALGRPEKDINKEAIFESIKKINIISSEIGEDFYINEDWDNVEYFLKSTILEDISKEFKKQAN